MQKPKPAAVLLALDGVVRAGGGHMGNALPIFVDYEKELVTGIDGTVYEIEVPRPAIAVMRAANMAILHPQTDYSHKCHKCNEVVGVFPTGQQIIIDEDPEILCDVCVGDVSDVLATGTLVSPVNEVREALDFTRKNTGKKPQ